MVHALSTSCVAGDIVRFHADSGSVHVADVASGTVMGSYLASAGDWALKIPIEWPSSLYRASFASGDAYFVVRSPVPSSSIVVSIPFPTWQAYNMVGVSGAGLYGAEQPDRATQVSFDRAGGGPTPGEWELGLLGWLGPAGYQVDYCSGLDLHGIDDLLDGYQLLVINGHDEYWSKPMRDSVERFVRRGGNLAILSGNTCWWQVRFDDDLRTMVCYRDATADPLTARAPDECTVEWSSEPVNRPENTMTGASFARGAGCWLDVRVMAHESYTTRFAEHWVFAGTALRDGDPFGRGAVGYETDAADHEDIDGVPVATGRDGGPPSLVILATADLAHWRHHGKGGAATMSIHQLGAGTVFNVGSINWGNSINDPVLDRVTRNVLGRLSLPAQARRWDVIGPSPEIVAVTACEGDLFGLTTAGLVTRPVSGQNRAWRPVGDHGGTHTVAGSREACVGAPVGLYGVTARDIIRYRAVPSTDAEWSDVGVAPAGTVGLAAVDESLFAITAGGRLWHLAMSDLGGGVAGWRDVDSARGAHCVTAMHGRLFVISAGRIMTRSSARGPADWLDIGSAGDSTVLAAWLGRLIGAVPGDRLQWRSGY